LKKLLKKLLMETDKRDLSFFRNDMNSSLTRPLGPTLAENRNVLQTLYKDCADVIFRSFRIGGTVQAVLIYIEGLSNIEELDRGLLTPLVQMKGSCGDGDIFALMEQTLTTSQAKPVHTFADAVDQISSGNPVIFVDGQAAGVSVGLAKFEHRSVEEPSSEAVVRGPREGFTESLSVNTSLLRRKLKGPSLKMIAMNIGRYSRTRVIIAYIEGLVDSTLVEEVVNRLGRIDIDGILESGYIEELIEDDPYSPFPQVLNTERPDVVCSGLLEGRVAILTDSTPFALVVPTTLYSLLQSAEDYYHRFLIGTLIRWLRYMFLLIALLLPSFYVAILTFHQEMIPTTLLLSVAKSREQVPFPALIEALMMEVAFEILREAGIRLPKQVGAAVSIVGALVIGQAAVSAGLISTPMVMVVAITGIASFAIPRYNAAIAIRMLRFPLMFLAGTLGLLGLIIGLLAIIVHLCALRSFGVPYLSPMGPMMPMEMKDVLLRAPWWAMLTRPRLTGKGNKYREVPGLKPDPQKGTE